MIKLKKTIIMKIIFSKLEKKMEERLKTNNNSPEKYIKLMRSVNPLVIPRNHNVEEALKQQKKIITEPSHNRSFKCSLYKHTTLLIIKSTSS